MATTTHFGLTKPTVGGSDDTWGGSYNVNFDIIDDKLNEALNGAGNAMSKAGGTFTGAVTGTTFTGTFAGPLTGNASTATQLATARTVGITSGPIRTALVAFNGTSNVGLTSSIDADALTIAMTAGLQGALDAKLARAGGEVGPIKAVGGGAHLHHGNAGLDSGKITFGPNAPTGGATGDIHFQYD